MKSFRYGFSSIPYICLLVTGGHTQIWLVSKPGDYTLHATTVDDAIQKITLVTRGSDLFDATHVHCLLQALLDLPSPDYQHHRLIMGPDKKRLAKRAGASTLRQLREEGKTPDEVRTLAGFGNNQY